MRTLLKPFYGFLSLTSSRIRIADRTVFLQLLNLRGNYMRNEIEQEQVSQMAVTDQKKELPFRAQQKPDLLDDPECRAICDCGTRCQRFQDRTNFPHTNHWHYMRLSKKKKHWNAIEP